MDLELKDRRGINSAISSFSRIWPYITIVALLILLAVTNLNKPASQPSHGKNIVRNTLLVRLCFFAMFGSFSADVCLPLHWRKDSGKLLDLEKTTLEILVRPTAIQSQRFLTWRVHDISYNEMQIEEMQHSSLRTYFLASQEVYKMQPMPFSRL